MVDSERHVNTGKQKIENHDIVIKLTIEDDQRTIDKINISDIDEVGSGIDPDLSIYDHHYNNDIALGVWGQS